MTGSAASGKAAATTGAPRLAAIKVRSSAAADGASVYRRAARARSHLVAGDALYLTIGGDGHRVPDMRRSKEHNPDAEAPQRGDERADAPAQGHVGGMRRHYK